MKKFTLTVDEGTRVRTLTNAEIGALVRGTVGAGLTCAISGIAMVASIAFVVKVGGRNIVVSRTHVREAEDRYGVMAVTFDLFVLEGREAFDEELERDYFRSRATSERARERRASKARGEYVRGLDLVAVARLGRMVTQQFAAPARGVRNDRAAKAARINGWDRCRSRTLASA
jgi:hypothetical protein